MKKILLNGCLVLSSALFLSSCTQEEVIEYQIVTDCNDQTCSIELDNVDLFRYTNMLGKKVDQVLKSEPVGDAEGTQFDITWSISGGDYATAQQMSDAGLAACENDVCSDIANPTGYVFDEGGSHQISVIGTVTYKDGRTQQISENTTVDLAHLTSVLYEIPTGSTKTADEIATAFGNYSGNKGGVATVTAEDGKLRFTCETGYHVTRQMVELAPGSQIYSGWGSNRSVSFDANDEQWEESFSIRNNYEYSAFSTVYNITAAGCIAD
ncbi:DUF3281 family protein [Allofrancisella guangzhouensis]|uniref:Lipoprotein n=1 Tax=Allofrancisella guangzhouensis TaxID=594679 RepID=A0A0A8E3L8_9GAMM|nr:DUF3281 family protein [Allofrancisella guangzhouensis]AJC48207.1 hypothetical protein SD28_00280 [Allofrancisella guangzhouensis]MBK2027174.1 DUF3281 family protein [Allofrancisella guangzhouensis]MBK2044763.1 DUF3281 family protein [Allofrancisella guangzhouensis]MBK2045984.1 DUF3281 family protein [Allofrancisella guangzhouensis]